MTILEVSDTKMELASASPYDWSNDPVPYDWMHEESMLVIILPEHSDDYPVAQLEQADLLRQMQFVPGSPEVRAYESMAWSSAALMMAGVNSILPEGTPGLVRVYTVAGFLVGGILGGACLKGLLGPTPQLAGQQGSNPVE